MFVIGELVEGTCWEYLDKGRKKYRGLFICRGLFCEGSIQEIEFSKIKKGGSKKCVTCSNKDRRTYISDKDTAIFYTFNHYKNDARHRSLKFELSFTEFSRIIQNNCAFCKKVPSLILYQEKTGKRNSKPYNRWRIEVSGVDRLINTNSYKIGNVVPCCTICNDGKNDREYFEWCEHCVLRSPHLWTSVEDMQDKISRIALSFADNLYEPNSPSGNLYTPPEPNSPSCLIRTKEVLPLLYTVGLLQPLIIP